MANPVVWFEVVGADAKALQAFYGDLFGWQFDTDNPVGFGMVAAQGEGIPGGVGPAQQGPGWTTFYVQVDDVEAAVAKATSAGGTVLMPPTQLPTTRIAVIADPEGHPVGLATPQAAAA